MLAVRCLKDLLKIFACNDMTNFWETQNHEVDFYKGLLVIAEIETQQSFVVQLNDNRGRNITRKQFADCVNSHGIDRACGTFKKLAGAKQ